MTALIILAIIVLFGGFGLILYGFEKRKEFCCMFGIILFFNGRYIVIPSQGADGNEKMY